MVVCLKLCNYKYNCVLKRACEVLFLCLCAFLGEMSLFSHLEQIADNTIIETISSSLPVGSVYICLLLRSNLKEIKTFPFHKCSHDSGIKFIFSKVHFKKYSGFKSQFIHILYYIYCYWIYLHSAFLQLYQKLMVFSFYCNFILRSVMRTAKISSHTCLDEKR